MSIRGLIGTSIFHALVLFLLLFFGFSYPDPPPEEEGILVNFGDSETGLGRIEPKGDPFQGGETEIPQISAQTTPVPPVKKEAAVQKTLTDIEESPVKVKKPTEEELKKQELERIRQEELKKQREEELRQQELERIRQEELRKQREEEERQRQQAENIRKMGKGAFSNPGAGTSDGSEGISQGPGNQGRPEGVPGAPNYLEGSGFGSGISFGGLGNRTASGLPKPLLGGCDVTSKITIRVQINVDREGKVVGEPRILEATFQDDCIYKAVIEAASKARFNADQNAAIRQQGWIRYIIEP